MKIKNCLEKDEQIVEKGENYYTPANRMFSGVYWNQPVCLCVHLSICVSVCVQNTTFCQSAGGGIKSHSVTAQVLIWSDPAGLTER